MKGVNYRETRGMPYVRREYIAGKPQMKIARFSSGLAGNKRMAQAGETSFFSMLRVYPHVLLRENKMIATAGADRLQEGMRRAFGKSTGLAARIKPGQVIYEAYIAASNLELAQDGFKMAASKIGRPTITRITPLKEQAMATVED